MWNGKLCCHRFISFSISRDFYFAESRGIHPVLSLLMDCVSLDMEFLVRFTSRRWYPKILYKYKSFAPSPLYMASLIIVMILRTDSRELFIDYLSSGSSTVRQSSLSSSCDSYECSQLDVLTDCSATKTRRRNLRLGEIFVFLRCWHAVQDVRNGDNF